MKTLLSIFALTGVLVVTNNGAFAQNAPDDAAAAQFSSRVEMAALPPVVSDESMPDAEEVVGIGAASPANDIGLTDEQLEKMHNIKSAFRDSASKKMSDVKSLQRQLKDLFLQEKVDRAKASELQGKISALKGDLSAAKLAMRLDSMDVLTAEQRQKMRHKALQREALGGGRRGGSGCGGKRMPQRKGNHHKMMQP